MTKPLIVLVCGTGRSGTSTTARILHENIGINMGDNLPDPKWQNPKGCYEEQVFFNADAQLLGGQITFPFWISVIKNRIGEMTYPWGFKSPLLSYTLPWYLAFLPADPIIFWCTRDVQKAADSCVRCYDWHPDRALGEMSERLWHLSSHLKGKDYVEVNFDTERSDSDIEQQLREALDAKGFSLGS